MCDPKPRICCLDLDTFFVSVERLLDPSLVGKPVVVGGRPGQRGVVTAASYEVRKLGVHSGMSMTQAVQLAPKAVFISTRHGTYGDYSKRVRDILDDFCPLIQTASIDEFYLDFSGCERLHRKASDISDDATIQGLVTRLTDTIENETGLPSSAGIGTSKQVAKISCSMAKPRGVLLIPAGTEADFLSPLPTRCFPGIGPVAERKLAQIGITTLGQVARLPLETLEALFGKWASSILSGTQGQGAGFLGRDRPAFLEHDPEKSTVGSISNERTFKEDQSDPASISSQLCFLCEKVCWRARKRGVKARTMTLKLRYADFQTISRARSFAPTNSELELYPMLKDILAQARKRQTPIRLLGVALSNLGLYDGQLSLFGQNHQRLHSSVDAIRQKYGFDSVHLASTDT